MKTIEQELIFNQVINKSEFITYLSPIESINDAKAYLKQVKENHPKATHHVCCYIIGKNGEFGHTADDGEPSGTAGLPIMEVFKRNSITNFICVVVRYFGGIKLGAGGLIRAYSSSASLALKEAKVVEILEYTNLSLTFSYNLQGIIDNFLKDFIILSKEYNTTISYQIKILKNQEDKLITDLNNLTNSNISIQKID